MHSRGRRLRPQAVLVTCAPGEGVSGNKRNAAPVNACLTWAQILVFSEGISRFAKRGELADGPPTREGRETMRISLLAALILAAATLPTLAEGRVQGVVHGTAEIGQGAVQGTAQAGKGLAQGTATVARHGPGDCRRCARDGYGRQEDRQGRLVHRDARLRLLTAELDQAERDCAAPCLHRASEAP